MFSLKEWPIALVLVLLLLVLAENGVLQKSPKLGKFVIMRKRYVKPIYQQDVPANVQLASVIQHYNRSVLYLFISPQGISMSMLTSSQCLVYRLEGTLLSNSMWHSPRQSWELEW